MANWLLCKCLICIVDSSCTKSEKKLLECTMLPAKCGISCISLCIGKPTDRSAQGVKLRQRSPSMLPRCRYCFGFGSSALYKLRGFWLTLRLVFCCFAINFLYRTPKSRADFHKYRHLLFYAVGSLFVAALFVRSDHFWITIHWFGFCFFHSLYLHLRRIYVPQTSNQCVCVDDNRGKLKFQMNL